MIFKQTWLILLLLLWCTGAVAERVSGLYEAAVPVVGQGAQARAPAMREAFGQVLIKISGNRDLLQQEDLAKRLKRAPRYVQQYRYRMLEQPLSDDPAPVVDPENPLPDRLLWVRFDEKAVNRLLREASVPVWGGTRPSTLVWLTRDAKGRRTLYQQDMEPELATTVTETADQRGLPVVMPLMDLEDRNALQVSDLWGDFEENIRRASQRYLPDVILAGRLHRQGGQAWSGDWTLYLPDGVEQWQIQGKSDLALAREGVQQAVDLLAARFAPQSASQGVEALRIRVSGMLNLADYVLVKDYLRSLVMIEQLDLLAAGSEQVSFLARVQGGREALERGILLGGVLESVVTSDEVVEAEASPPEDFDVQSLDYRLRQ
ncbi:MAG: hypothetical protein OI74_00190 [Gammaproteobacteria bacterium (ex Lamellibrachia satsuma)]|nr:MAG: DUF2066 domain-containing protein [Gammaproteobacteria bacterium (ex Lamellibrachia satsuma)]RRS36090.1 MAG: hypothetical protein OI74_00190 [Gammaproteobacteria bacterium (ex Lamellibrachia satsuma)]RRS37221.1 MAG: hypothetical protein NV67_02210 [Gammaproteobacteria bacterium (ex Lamellibrachia satsuma)]